MGTVHHVAVVSNPLDFAEVSDGDHVPDAFGEGQYAVTCNLRLRVGIREMSGGHELSDQVDVEVVRVCGHGAQPSCLIMSIRSDLMSTLCIVASSMKRVGSMSTSSQAL